MEMMGRAWKTALAAGVGLAVLAVVPAAAKEGAPRVTTGSYAGAYLAGRVAEVDNDYASAVAYYGRALLLDPGNQQLQQSLMLAQIAAGDFDAALPLADKLKAVPETERFSRLVLAVDSFRKKQFGKAEYWLKLSLESDLDRLVTAIMSAWAVEGQGRGRDALTAIDAIKGPDWFRLFTSYHRALIAESAGMKDEAEKSYALLLNDADAAATAPDTYLRGAEAYAGFLGRSGKKAEALQILDKAGEAQPGRASLAGLRTAIEAGKPVPPLAPEASAGAAEILTNMATALNRSGGEPFVRLYLQYALALNPNSDDALLQLASVEETQANAQGAIDLYRRIPEASPIKRAAELQLGLNLADLKKYDEAIAQLKRLVEAEPDDMRAYLALGGVYGAKEDYRSAADLYDRAVTRLKTPQAANWNIFYQRGIAFERLKEWPKAETNFLKALELSPDQPQVMNYLGYSWVDMNTNLDRGLDLIRKAVDLRPGDGYIVDSLGWAYYRLGRFPEAVTELERAVSLKPDDAVLNDHLGDAYWRAGRKLEATFQWTQARDLKPDPDVLAQVQKKLSEGLPPLPDKKAAEEEAPPAVDKAPAAPAIAPAVPDKG